MMKRPPQSGQALSREQLILLLETGLDVGKTQFVRLLSAEWLNLYPGDMLVTFLQAKAYLLEGKVTQAIPILEILCRRDPQYLQAQELRLQAYRVALSKQVEVVEITPRQKIVTERGKQDAAGCLLALGLDTEENDALIVPLWGRKLLEARRALMDGDFDLGETCLQSVLGDALTPLTGLTQLQIIRARNAKLPMEDRQSLRTMAEFYLSRWPDCVPILLLLAEALIDSGEAEHGVELLHQAARLDVDGQTSKRLWGEEHPYRSLWPEGLTMTCDFAIPAAVSGVLGWNQLPLPAVEGHSANEVSQAIVSHQPIPRMPASREETVRRRVSERLPQETLLPTDTEMQRIAERLRQPHLAHTEGRFPVYVVFSTRKGLLEQYGQSGYEAINTALGELTAAINSQLNWNARLLYADDPVSAAASGIKPVPANDPWSLKLALADLDKVLAKTGEMIGAVLIVGGPEVVPFHKLPNPVDDTDLEVLSDNPYMTCDENYFVPEWPLGRLPAGKGNDPRPLLKMIQAMTQHYLGRSPRSNWLREFIEALYYLLVGRGNGRVKKSLGYTAAVWREASREVFRPIGGGQDLVMSPPLEASSFRAKYPLPVRLGYFNLHGVPDAPEWFGQADADHPYPGTDYPIALRPQDVRNSGYAPLIVFSEACYGAYILGKEVEQALALKFMNVGTQVVVGSTCTSYGAVTEPLIAADLLGYSFWKYLREGLPAGEALKQAKINLVSEMHKRQGYLDGEDQKTLISFVLYGDPLSRLDAARRAAKEVLRPLQIPRIKTIHEEVDELAEEAMSPQTLEAVKQVVAKYLPGMVGAQISLSHMIPDANGNGRPLPERKVLTTQVITLRKEVANATKVHRHFARLTIDQSGKVLKMAVSR